MNRRILSETFCILENVCNASVKSAKRSSIDYITSQLSECDYSDVRLHFLGNDKYKFCRIQRHNEYFLAERKLALCSPNLNVHAS